MAAMENTMKNYMKATLIMLAELCSLAFFIYMGKEVVGDMNKLTPGAVFYQCLAMLSVPLICLMVFWKDAKPMFVLKEKKLLLIISLLYILFFLLRRQFDSKGLYGFVEDIVIVAFTEEFIFRGLVYTYLKRENRMVAILISGLVWGILHAVAPTIIAGEGLTFFLSSALNKVGFGIMIGYCFICLYEKSGTLLMPIMVHALYNYSMGFGLLFLIATLCYLIRRHTPDVQEEGYKVYE